MVDQVKGVQEGLTVTVRQFGVTEPVHVGDGKQLVTRVPGMPIYEPDQEVLLFLVKESPIGLSSPVGLGQGAFQVRRYGEAKKSLVNELNNRNLGKGLSASWLRSRGLSDGRVEQLLNAKDGPMDYDRFIQTLRQITGTP